MGREGARRDCEHGISNRKSGNTCSKRDNAARALTSQLQRSCIFVLVTGNHPERKQHIAEVETGCFNGDFHFAR